jgi:hypothetical protein
LQEDYRALPNKTRTFFGAVTQQRDPDWVIKMDDDVYLNTARLLDVARQWDVMGAQLKHQKQVQSLTRCLLLRTGQRWERTLSLAFTGAAQVRQTCLSLACMLPAHLVSGFMGLSRLENPLAAMMALQASRR